jgi:hypothetical protein
MEYYVEEGYAPQNYVSNTPNQGPAMSTVIQIKRSTGVTAPTTTALAEGELAYSQDRTNDGKGAILYIESVASDGTTQVIDKIGGKYYTNTVDEFLAPETGTVGAKVSLNDADASHSVSLQAPATVAADVTYTLPAAPTENHFLKTDASGNLSWSEVSGNTISINGLTEETTLADADEFIVYDASATSNKKITAENIADYIFGGVSGDITIDEAGVASIAADAVELGTNTTGDYVESVSGTANQIQVTGTGEGASVTVALTDDVTLVGDLTVGGNDIKANGGTTAITLSGADVAVAGDLTVTGNDIKSSTGTTAITLDGADVTIAGSLTVNGTSTLVNSTIVSVDDNLFKLADGNAANSVDVGVYGQYTESSTVKYSGWFRDASDSNIIKFFKGLETEPSTTVDTAAASYEVATILANITGGTISGLSADIAVADGGTGASTFTMNGVLYGNGTDPIQATAAGTAGYFLYSNNGTPDWTNVVDGGTY